MIDLFKKFLLFMGIFFIFIFTISIFIISFSSFFYNSNQYLGTNILILIILELLLYILFSFILYIIFICLCQKHLKNISNKIFNILKSEDIIEIKIAEEDDIEFINENLKNRK